MRSSRSTSIPIHWIDNTIETPVGPLTVTLADDGTLRSRWCVAEQDSAASGDVPSGVLERLANYADGKIVSFDDVETPPGPAFVRACWTACRAVPRGTTISYGKLAERAGSPGAARAAGQAMKNNLLAVIIPCHRIVASDGSLHGYAGCRSPSGRMLAIKRWLLEIEGWGANESLFASVSSRTDESKE